MKILIAEDEPISRLALEATVPQWGFSPIAVGDGVDALNILTAYDGAPHLAIIDWMMPGIDGIEVCKAVREAVMPVSPYILMLTTRTEQQDIIDGLRAGADDYVRKPFDRVELQARLQVGLRVIRLQLQLLDRVRELEEGRARERVLQRLVPICAYCRRIRDDQDYWQGIERYVSQSAGLQFSHGVCPDCVHNMERELEDFRNTLNKD